MGKYIVELKKNETLYKAATRESDGTAYVYSAIGTPYTEPDLEQVRKEGYEAGAKSGAVVIADDKAHEAYQHGLNDAWDAARKIANIPYGEEEKVFGSGGWAFIKKHTASEAIEKIRQYEQEQEEQVHIGDEYCCAGTHRCVITDISDNFYRILWDCGTSSVIDDLTYMKSTGRHFPEIAEVLQKMKKS